MKNDRDWAAGTFDAEFEDRTAMEEPIVARGDSPRDLRTRRMFASLDAHLNGIVRLWHFKAVHRGSSMPRSKFAAASSLLQVRLMSGDIVTQTLLAASYREQFTVQRFAPVTRERPNQALLESMNRRSNAIDLADTDN